MSVGVRRTLCLDTVAFADAWSIRLVIVTSEELRKSVMLAQMNAPVKSEVRLAAATTGAAHGDGKKELGSDSGALCQMSHTQAGMTAYKKAPAGTTVKVADGAILTI